MSRTSLVRFSLLSIVAYLLLAHALAADLDTLLLKPRERIVIVAPHPDDEVVACGGLIQQALGLGCEVWVVYVTSGDGSWPSAWKVTGNLFPGPKDYLTLGRARMEEAKAGARVLGLDTSHLVFLGFPDAELDRLVFEHYYDAASVKSSHTGLDRSLYDPSRFWYRGRDIMLALYDLVGWRRVDRIFLPHPLDAHRDHWAVAALMPAIREFWRRCNGSQFPVIHYYLVHRPTYPSGYVQAGLLTPPEDLTGHGHHWYTLPVSPARAARKQAALRCHWSQAMELGPDLNQHVALNELFDAPDPDGGIARGDAPATRLLSGPRIDSVTASLSSRGRAVFELHLAGAPSPQLDYRIYVWSFGPVIINHTVDLKEDTTEQARALIRQLVATPGTSITDPVCVASDSGWIAYLPSKWFNNNFMIYFAADVRWKGTLLNHAGVGWVVPSWY